MPIREWSDEFVLNIAEVDEHHKRLIGFLNELNDAMKAGKGREQIEATLYELTNYTKYHFSKEEELMSLHNYPELEKHKIEHSQFIEKLLDFKEDFNSGRKLVTIDVLTFLTNWLIKHILGTDKKFAPFLKEKGVK